MKNGEMFHGCQLQRSQIRSLKIAFVNKEENRTKVEVFLLFLKTVNGRQLTHNASSSEVKFTVYVSTVQKIVYFLYVIRYTITAFANNEHPALAMRLPGKHVL